MPEGDTVWLTAQRLDRALGGRELTVADLRVPQVATADLSGRSVLEVVPRGKHLLIRLDGAVTLHSHLKMDGSWYLCRASERPRGHPDHMIRAQLGNLEWLATGYRVHDLKLVPTEREYELVGHLGPDLLGPDWDASNAVARLRREPDRPIAEALLDQRNLAGIGNLYKCEVLFIERVNPWKPVAAVADLDRLVATAHRLLYANREHPEHPEQSTTGFMARGRQHWVYQRRSQPCLRCRTPIRRADQGAPPGQRSSYWCPNCQPG
jgi:endonuclease VIII